MLTKRTVNGFLSTLSLRRATIDDFIKAVFSEYFYPRSPCGERPGKNLVNGIRLVISIHALLAESDRPLAYLAGFGSLFLSTLSLRRATDEIPYQRQIDKFLSTLSLRRATCYSLRHSASRWHFYPRSPCGERPVTAVPLMFSLYFYPRSPCGERLDCYAV